MLRLLIGAHVLMFAVALAEARDLADWPERVLALAASVEPLLLVLLVLLALGRDLFWRQPLRLAQAEVLLLAVALAGLAHALGAGLGLTELHLAAMGRGLILVALSVASLLAYFEWRAEGFSPALVEARLSALDSRIRPHFLFNTLNAVLSLVRSQPRRAEEALEALSDLYRAALKDGHALVPAPEEMALGRQYLDLEQLRLGERLNIDWPAETLPAGLLMPPLMLQPLLENAVYHGIEPLPGGGTVRLAWHCDGDLCRIEISNPAPPAGRQATGCQMAVHNIRERLALYYDLEARLENDSDAQGYHVRMILPRRQP